MQDHRYTKDVNHRDVGPYQKKDATRLTFLAKTLFNTRTPRTAPLTPIRFGRDPTDNIRSALFDADAPSAIDSVHAAGTRYFDTTLQFDIVLSETRCAKVMAHIGHDEVQLPTKIDRLLLGCEPETAKQGICRHATKSHRVRSFFCLRDAQL